ncbi:hypothetical protein N7534_004946 [Penicillium rubens]|nr:hypothetical protein N7534_004946 [Penicillium rubens]
MANNSFRDSVNSLGWSRRDPDLPRAYWRVIKHPIPISSTAVMFNCPLIMKALEPHCQQPLEGKKKRASLLPIEERNTLTRTLRIVSRWDRMLIFAACNLGAAVCFMLCFFLFPVLTLKPRKFAVLWSVGSVLFLVSWAVLMGPWTYAKHLISGTRLPFTAAYFGSIALTLYFAIGLQSLFLTLISSIFQLAALVWYLVSYFPMGSTGLQYVGRFGASRVTSWING